MQKGNDVTILSTGNVLPMSVEIAAALNGAGISAGLESFHTVKPLDEECLADVFSRNRVVATIEEHSRIGGFGGAVAEWLADHPQPKAGSFASARATNSSTRPAPRITPARFTA